MEDTAIAKVCHAVNRAYCQSMGDDSQLPWLDAPLWQRESVFDGVIFHKNHPDAGPNASHEEWMRCKLKEGWVWGEEKNLDDKTHPCLIPFEELPREQQAKDYLFRQVVHSLLEE